VKRDYQPVLFFYFSFSVEQKCGVVTEEESPWWLILTHFINQLTFHYGSIKQTWRETLADNHCLFLTEHFAPQLICWKIYGSDLLKENHGLDQECELVPSQECWVEPTQVQNIITIHLSLLLSTSFFLSFFILLLSAYKSFSFSFFLFLISSFLVVFLPP
jgi:hypothetical protein